LLSALRAALDPAGAPLTPADAPADGDGPIWVRVELAGGGAVVLEGSPVRNTVVGGEFAPSVLFATAEARAGPVLAEVPARENAAGEALEVFRAALTRATTTSASRALSLVDALESYCERGLRGHLLLIEEPELYLRPQAQRYLCRLLREFSLTGNQAIYSTHSPAFLNVARLNELVFVERVPRAGTRALQAEPVSPDDAFRVMTEFDAARSELFLASAAVLVEGLTEKLVLPFVFAALGYDADREKISIVECGGKPNLPLFTRICRATGVPFVVMHDSDRRPSGRLVAAESALNSLIADTAGEDRVIVLDPDFEAVAGLTGQRHKPERAWRQFAERASHEMPPALRRVVELAVSLSRA
jgi:hypothetical protein